MICRATTLADATRRARTPTHRIAPWRWLVKFSVVHSLSHCCPHSIACFGHLNTTATFIFDFIPFDFQQNLQPIVNVVVIIIIIIIVVVTHALVRVQLPENVSCCCAVTQNVRHALVCCSHHVIISWGQQKKKKKTQLSTLHISMHYGQLPGKQLQLFKGFSCSFSWQ